MSGKGLAASVQPDHMLIPLLTSIAYRCQLPLGRGFADMPHTGLLTIRQSALKAARSSLSNAPGALPDVLLNN